MATAFEFCHADIDSSDRGALGSSTPGVAGRRAGWLAVATFGFVLGGGSLPAGERQPRAFSEEEIQAFWEGRVVPEAPHQSYIFIAEDEIVDGTELPEYRVEASRYGPMHQLERMVKGDSAVAARIASLAPELAAVTEYRRRTETAFFTARPGVARDVPQTGDVVGPLLQFIRSRF